MSATLMNGYSPTGQRVHAVGPDRTWNQLARHQGWTDVKTGVQIARALCGAYVTPSSDTTWRCLPGLTCKRCTSAAR